MYRYKRILEVIDEDNLVENCRINGDYLKSKMEALCSTYPSKINSPRGLGLFAAFDASNTELRNKITAKSIKNGLMILGCGSRSIRFRPPVTVTKEHIDEAFVILDKILSSL